MFWQTNLNYEFGPFLIDTRERVLFRNGLPVVLTPKVFDLLLVFVQNSGHVLGKDELMKLIWPDTAVEEGNIARNISTLRKVLGERPSESQYVQTIPWRGYRFVADVREVRNQAPTLTIESIAVLPFASKGSDLAYLSEGIPEQLISKLSRFPELKVVSRNSAYRYRGDGIDASIVGRALNVQAVLIGDVSTRNDLISISVELVATRDDRQLWGAQYNRQPSAVSSLTDEIVNELSAKLRLRHITLAKDEVQNEAYHDYLKGRFHFNKLTMEGVEKGRSHFEEAIRKAPGYALAYTGLLDCYNYLGRRAEAKEAAARALALDPSLGEVRASLAFHEFLYEWNFAAAEQGLLSALKLSPGYALANHWYAIYLANLGGSRDAMPYAQRAVELDPLSLMMNMTPALVLYLDRQYKRAAEVLLKIIDMEQNFPVAHSVLGNVYCQQGKYDEALVEYQLVVDQSKGVSVVENAMKVVMAHLYARCREEQKAHELLAEVLEAEVGRVTPEAKEKRPQVSHYSVAAVYAALGDTEKAFEFLNKAYDERDVQLVSLKVDPILDPIRGDARLEELIKRVGLDCCAG